VQKINSIVAEISPNLYSAAKQAGLSVPETNQVEQMSYAIKQHRDLMKLDGNLARTKYNQLDTNIQEGLKFLFKDADYLQPSPDAGDRIFGVLKGAVKLAASPLITLFKVAGGYNRIINTPYLVARQAVQGKEVFNTRTWRDAWDGKRIYDEEALRQATNYFGADDTFVAQGLLAGRTPGEIIEDYGSVNNNILASIQKAFNEPDKFKDILSGVKYAQVSVGRDIARGMFDDRPPANGGLHGDYISNPTKVLSGILDFTYQIVIDPLTWLSGGLIKGATKGEKLANMVTQKALEGNLKGGVEQAFKDPQVFTLWENALGPAIRNFAESKTVAEKTNAYRYIVQNFPGYADRKAIEAFAKKDVSIFDAKSAQKYFEQGSNVNLMLSGRVQGVTYARNGVAVAKTHRQMLNGLNAYLDSVFNSTTSKTLGRLRSTGRTDEELNVLGEKVNQSLIKTGEIIDGFANPNPDMTVINEAAKEIRGWKNPKRWGMLAARSPSGLEVRLGEQAVETAQNFTLRARQILPRDLAEFMTTKFLAAKEDEQIVILRNLDAATMHAMGLGGEPQGRELMEKILREKYGGKAGFATLRDTEINALHAAVMEPSSLKEVNGVKFLQNEEVIQPYQATKAVGSLPYDQIASMVTEIRSKKNLIYSIGGSTQSAFAKKIVDNWSLFTLFPRLGIRSAIDESIMYLLTAPTRDLLSFAWREGNRLGKVTTIFTGSKDSTGLIKQGLTKVFRKGRTNNYNLLPPITRTELIEAEAKRLGTSVDLLTNLEKRETIASHVMSVYGSKLNDKQKNYLFQALVHQPDALNSIASSFVARSGLSGAYSDEILESMITPTMLDRAWEQMGVKSGKGTQTLDSTKLASKEVALVQFDKLFKSFVGNKVELANNKYVKPSEIFFKHNGLKPGEVIPGTDKATFSAALDDLMEQVGFKFSSTTYSWRVIDQKSVNLFKQYSARSVTSKDKGLSDAQIVRDQASRIFADMYTTFHGNTNLYNQELMDLVQKSYREISALAIKTGRIPTWGQAVSRISLDVFEEASRNFRISGMINTDLAFKGFTDVESLFKKHGSFMMELMDRQVNGIYRQPAIMVTYVKLREKYAGIEQEYAQEIFKKMSRDNPKKLITNEDGLISLSEELARKRFTEIATREAADVVLKFADNPAIRSNFSFSVRTLGRYYRATEDFYRRVYRLKDVSPRVLYRLRLTHLGLDATGMVHQDANGEPYVIMPMDNIVFKATDGTIRALTGKSGYSQPLFNEFTLKLRMVNPSFQQDAGLPTLSGPIAGLGVIAIKNLLGQGPSFTKKLGESIDTFALGNIGDNLDITRAIVPASLQRVWAILPFNEKSRQEVTAAHQAIAYNAAHGLYLDTNSTAKEKSNYLNNIRISAHNILVMRNLLGLISPVTPTTQESLDIPDYIKDVGITGLRAEFFDILTTITKDKSGDVQDPYELALATFIGKNPGKLVYTVSREDKQTKVLVNNTDQLKNWAIGNEKFINTYGEVAYIFAPQIGKFNAASYNWVKAAGLVTSKSIEQYYLDVLVSEDKQKYYDIARNEKDLLNRESDSEKRANIINDATDARDALKTANPLLEAALIGEGNNIGQEATMLSTLEQIVNDEATNINTATRQRMSLAIRMIRDFISFAIDPNLKDVSNITELKRNRKLQIEADLRELMVGDLYITEANRAIFKTLLNFYSRDSYAVYRKAS